MAKFLKTTTISSHLEDIINNAKEKLYLISPYLQINSQLKLLLDDTTRRYIKTCIVYGKEKDLNYSDKDWIDSIPRIRLYFYNSLHAKCYINEKEAIVTSMNLYTYSQQNNCEMGIYITLKDDPELYNDVLTEAERIIRQSEEIQKPKKNNKAENRDVNKWHSKQDFKEKIHYGYCIRTGIEIPFNPSSPLSFKAFSSWAKFSDEYYPEKYCHFSGEESHGETNYAKPILKKNWKDAQRMFDL